MKLITLFFSPVIKYRSRSSIKQLILIRFCYLMILVYSFTSCSEILSVPNISHERVEILSPSDEATVDELPVTLSWIGVQDASHYRIQIFTPSIEKNERILIDSILTNEFYTDSLLTGELEWRVRAENSSYQSPYSSRKLKIVIPSITTDKIELLAPVEGVVQSDFETLFSWNSAPNAVNYRVQIGKPNFEELEELVLDSIVTNSSLTYKFEDAGRYQWRIRGENQEKFSTYTTRNFTLEADTSLKDELVKLLAPQDNTTRTNGAVRFTWEAIEKADNYRIQVSTPNFESPEQFILDTITDETDVDHFFEDGKTYQWRVKALNEFAETSYSSRTFRVQVVPDLTSKTVKILAPVNNSKLTNTNVNLTWTAVEGASGYHVQIATPSFASALQIVADSRISIANFNQTLTASTTYEWRVRAENENSETGYTTSKFSVQ